MSSFKEIIVRGYHVDVYGHVNNARYLEFLEEARWAACDGKEVELAWFMQRKMMLAVNRVEIDYKRPAIMGDILQIETQIAKIAEKHLEIRQTITRQNKLVSSAVVYLCVIAPDVRGAVVLEGEVLARLTALLDSASPVVNA
jgi:thioesterase-3